MIRFNGEVQGYGSSMDSFSDLRATQKCHQIPLSLPFSPSLFFVTPWGICLRMKPVGRKATMATGGPSFCLVGQSAPSEKQCLSPESTTRARGGQCSLARPGRSYLVPVVRGTECWLQQLRCFLCHNQEFRKPLQNQVDREWRRAWFLKEKW